MANAQWEYAQAPEYPRPVCAVQLMRLLRIISSVNPESGGPIEGIRQLQAPLERMGHTIDIVCCDAPDAPWLRDTGEWNIYPLGPNYLGYSYTPKLAPWLKANAHRYDAVIVHGLWQYHSFAAWLVLTSSKLPYFVFTHGMLDPWFKRTYPLKHLKKLLYWPWAEYRVLRDARAVIFTCEEERRLARESFSLYQCKEAVVSYGTAPPPQKKQCTNRHFFKATSRSARQEDSTVSQSYS